MHFIQDIYSLIDNSLSLCIALRAKKNLHKIVSHLNFQICFEIINITATLQLTPLQFKWCQIFFNHFLSLRNTAIKKEVDQEMCLVRI